MLTARPTSASNVALGKLEMAAVMRLSLLSISVARDHLRDDSLVQQSDSLTRYSRSDALG